MQSACIAQCCTHVGCPACTEQMNLTPAGKLPTPVAAHLTAKGGWVEFHPSSNPSVAAASTSDAGAPTLPTLRPLAWFRFSTQEEQTVLESYLEDECRMHDRDTEFLYNHELSWWLGDTDTHQVADHWRGVLCLIYIQWDCASPSLSHSLSTSDRASFCNFRTKRP